MEAVVCASEDVGDVNVDAAVVIDVLRAFTVAPWLFARGAASLHFARDDAHALELKAALGKDARALKDGSPAPGFDLANSPGIVRESDLTGCHVVQRTTNGTAGVLAARHVPLVLCAGLVTAGATARRLVAARPRRVAFVVTGDHGAADEDLACAELVLGLSRGEDVDVAAVQRRVVESAAARALTALQADGSPGGNPDDIALCAEVDVHDFALVATTRDEHVVVTVWR